MDLTFTHAVLWDSLLLYVPAVAATPPTGFTYWIRSSGHPYRYFHHAALLVLHTWLASSYWVPSPFLPLLFTSSHTHRLGTLPAHRLVLRSAHTTTYHHYLLFTARFAFCCCHHYGLYSSCTGSSVRSRLRILPLPGSLLSVPFDTTLHYCRVAYHLSSCPSGPAFPFLPLHGCWLLTGYLDTAYSPSSTGWKRRLPFFHTILLRRYQFKFPHFFVLPTTCP